MLRNRLLSVLCLGLLAVSAVPASAASITLASAIGQGCLKDQTSTTDVATGAALTTTCTFSTPEGSIDDAIMARGIFDANGLSLGLYARMAQTTTSNELVDVVYGLAQFTDAYTVSTGSLGDQGILRFTFAVDGTYTAVIPPLGPGGTYANFETLFRVGTQSFSLTGPATITVDIPYISGKKSLFTAELMFGWSILARNFSGGTQSVNVVADFYNTAVLTSLEILDESGRPVPGAQFVASGSHYPVVTRPVAEPAALLLLAPAVAAVVRRRRQI